MSAGRGQVVGSGGVAWSGARKLYETGWRVKRNERPEYAAMVMVARWLFAAQKHRGRVCGQVEEWEVDGE